jgi:hypothetical protein
VYALTGTALGDVELPEAGERDVAPALQGFLDDVEHCVDGLPGFTLANVGPVRDLVDEL